MITNATNNTPMTRSTDLLDHVDTQLANLPASLDRLSDEQFDKTWVAAVTEAFTLNGATGRHLALTMAYVRDRYRRMGKPTPRRWDRPRGTVSHTTRDRDRQDAAPEHRQEANACSPTEPQP